MAPAGAACTPAASACTPFGWRSFGCASAAAAGPFVAFAAGRGAAAGRPCCASLTAEHLGLVVRAGVVAVVVEPSVAVVAEGSTFDSAFVGRLASSSTDPGRVLGWEG